MAYSDFKKEVRIISSAVMNRTWGTRCVSPVIYLRRLTADTGRLVAATALGIRRINMPSYRMANAGVMSLDLATAHARQGELDLEEEDLRDCGKLIATLDALNRRYGKATVHSAGTGTTNKANQWDMRQ